MRRFFINIPFPFLYEVLHRICLSSNNYRQPAQTEKHLLGMVHLPFAANMILLVRQFKIVRNNLRRHESTNRYVLVCTSSVHTLAIHLPTYRISWLSNSFHFTQSKFTVIFVVPENWNNSRWFIFILKWCDKHEKRNWIILN